MTFKENCWFVFLLLFVLSSCKKIENVDNRVNLLYSNSKAQKINDTTARINMRIYANSTYNNMGLLQPNFFSVDTGSFSVGNNTFTVASKVREISRTLIKGSASPISLLVLVDKSVSSNSFTSSFNQTQYLGLETALMNYYKNASGYEINIAGFATGNPGMQSSLQTASPVFKSNITNLNIDSVGFLFDVNKNAGTADLNIALDNALNYINQNAHYTKRAILLLTNFNSIIADSTEINRLANKALAYNTSISILNTDQDLIPYSHLKLVSQTNGMNCNNISSDVIKNGFDLLVPALNNYLTTGDYYNSVIEIKTSTVFFDRVIYTVVPVNVRIYNIQRGYSIELLYEK